MRPYNHHLGWAVKGIQPATPPLRLMPGFRFAVNPAGPAVGQFIFEPSDVRRKAAELLRVQPVVESLILNF